MPIKSKTIKTDPEKSWAVGRNDASIKIAGIQVYLYEQPTWFADEDAVNFSPMNRAGNMLVAGFQITRDEAIELAKAILELLDKPINYVPGSDVSPSITNGPSDPPSSDGS